MNFLFMLAVSFYFVPVIYIKATTHQINDAIFQSIFYVLVVGAFTLVVKMCSKEKEEN